MGGSYIGAAAECRNVIKPWTLSKIKLLCYVLDASDCRIVARSFYSLLRPIVDLGIEADVSSGAVAGAITRGVTMGVFTMPALAAAIGLALLTVFTFAALLVGLRLSDRSSMPRLGRSLAGDGLSVRDAAEQHVVGDAPRAGVFFLIGVHRYILGDAVPALGGRSAGRIAAFHVEVEFKFFLGVVA